MAKYGRSSVFTENRSSRAIPRATAAGWAPLGLAVVEAQGQAVEDEVEDIDGEIVSEEDLGSQGPVRPASVPEPYAAPGSPGEPIRGEVTTAALAVAGGALAGAATVAAVRAVGSVATGSRRSRRRRLRRKPRSSDVVASRSFLVDIHMLGR